VSDKGRELILSSHSRLLRRERWRFRGERDHLGLEVLEHRSGLGNTVGGAELVVDLFPPFELMQFAQSRRLLRFHSFPRISYSLPDDEYTSLRRLYVAKE
jgi:hypothetical protein